MPDERMPAAQYRVLAGLSIPRAEPKKRAQPERELQTAAVAMIEAMGIPVFAVPNGGSRHGLEAAIMNGAGVRPGVPDLVVVLPAGRVLWLEIKAGKGRLSPEQEGWRDALEARGHHWECCRSIDEINAVVRVALKWPDRRVVLDTQQKEGTA